MFCYICKQVVISDGQIKIVDFVKKTYQAYFVVKLGSRNKPFAPHICCKICVKNSRDWKNKKKTSMIFGISMLWREGKNCITDCCFCMTNLKGINHKNKYHVQYPDVPSATKLVSHCSKIPVFQPKVTMKFSSDYESSGSTNITECGTYRPEEDDQLV